jgi:hypothetical protein
MDLFQPSVNVSLFFGNFINHFLPSVNVSIFGGTSWKHFLQSVSVSLFFGNFMEHCAPKVLMWVHLLGTSSNILELNCCWFEV